MISITKHNDINRYSNYEKDWKQYNVVITAVKQKSDSRSILTIVLLKINGIFKWYALHQIFVRGILKIPFIFSI